MSTLLIAGLILMAGGVMLIVLGLARISTESDERMSEMWLWRQREREMRGAWFTLDEDEYLGPDDWTIDIELPPR